MGNLVFFLLGKDEIILHIKMQKNNLSERNKSIDLLRVICILYIVGYWHLFNYTNAFPSYNNYFTNSLTTIVLGTFAFISGFLLSQKRTHLNLDEILIFYRKRIIRIYPLYVIALILFKWAGVAQAFNFDFNFVKAALMISIFYPPSPPTLWFITMIMIFYFITPFLGYFANNVTGFIIFLISALIAFSLFYQRINPLDTRLIMYFPAFALGIILNQQKKLQHYCQQNPLILLFSLIPFFFLSLFRTGSLLVDTLFSIPLILNGVLIFFVYANYWSNKINPNSWIYFLSYASFCMYLFHRLIFLWTTKIFFPSHGVSQFLYLLFFSLPLTILLSWFSQKIYDAGLIKASNSWQRMRLSLRR